MPPWLIDKAADVAWLGHSAVSHRQRGLCPGHRPCWVRAQV